MKLKIIQIITITCVLAMTTSMLIAQQTGAIALRGLGLSQTPNSLSSEMILQEVIDLDITNQSIEQSLTIIAQKADLKLMYNKESLSHEERITLQNESISVYDALWGVLDGTGLQFALSQNRQLVILKMKKEITSEDLEADMELVSGSASLSSTGESLPGVNVLVSGTMIGTTTNLEGNYELDVPSLQDTLIFSYVGLQTQIVPIAGRTQIDVVMQPQAVSGEDIVVIGYATQSAETTTGSISSVQGNEVAQAPVTNVENALVGRLPGLVAVNSGGEPGSDETTIQIRGSNTLGDNSPLIVIDGVTNRTGGLSRLNPNDIEDITILKDASAAIYGSQAANGVILVTTKRGQVGDTQISVSYNQGFTQPTRLPEMADAATYAQMINEIDMYNGRGARYSEEDIQKYRSGSDPWTHPDTDWYDAAFKDYSSQSKLNVSVSGGSEAIQYHVSVGSSGETGFFKDSGYSYDQYNFRSNIDGQINEYLSVAVDLSGRRGLQDTPIRGVGATFRALMRGKPNLPAYWPTGEPGPDIEYGDNPVVTGTKATGYNKNKHDVFQSNVKFELEVPSIEGLFLESNLSYDKNYQFVKEWGTPWYLYTWDYQTRDENGNGILTRAQRGLDEPYLTQELTDGYQATVNLLGRYATDIEDHSISVLAGIERQESEANIFSAYREGFLTDAVDELSAGGDAQKDNSGSSFRSIRLNYFGRISYDYQDKYLLEFVGRYDGSYIFPEKKRFGFFPAVSVGWRLSEEPFWDNVLPFIEGFKLRGSWGQTGNDRIEPYQYLSTYGFGAGYVIDGLVQKSLTQARIGNPNVTWEIANQINAGFDAEMLGGRLSITADYFRYFRDDILWWRTASVPATAGFDLPRENIGQVVNRGVDGSITFSDQFGDVNFVVSANGGYAQNYIKNWDEAPGAPEWQKSTGSPMNTELYYQSDGVFNDQEELDSYPHWPGARPGDLKFVDINGDGVIDGQDRVRIDENEIPTFTGGLSLRAAYRNFDLSALIQGAAGANRYVFTESGEIGNFLQSYADNRWTPENSDSEHPRTYNRTNQYWADNQNTYFLRDADYVRLKTLEVGYELSNLLSPSIGIQSLRVYISGQNLFTIDKLNVMDPEVGAADGQYYPQSRVLNIGINLTL